MNLSLLAVNYAIDLDLIRQDVLRQLCDRRHITFARDMGLSEDLMTTGRCDEVVVVVIRLHRPVSSCAHVSERDGGAIQFTAARTQ